MMKITSHWPDATKHLSALVIGWGLLSILLGLFYAFDAMEASTDITPSMAIPFFLQVTVITFLIGSVVLSLPIFIWKLFTRKKEPTRE